MENAVKGDDKARINANKKAYIGNAMLAAENDQLDVGWIIANAGPDITTGNMNTARTILNNMSKYESPYAKHTQPVLYNDMVSKIGDPQYSTTEVMKVFDDNTGNFSVTDHGDFLTDITERDDPATVKGTLQPQKELTVKLATYGITSKDSPQLTATLSAYLDTSIKAAVANGKPLTDAEITKLIDDTTMDYGRTSSFEIDRPWSMSDAEGSNIWKAIGQHDQDKIPEIMYILQASNTPPTQANVQRVYERLLRGK
jgi:hypothetical protein